MEGSRCRRRSRSASRHSPRRTPRLLTLSTLFRVISRWLRESERPVVLVIGEVDSATNNQVFLDLLAQLRQQYLDRGKNSSIPAFQSVVLAV